VIKQKCDISVHGLASLVVYGGVALMHRGYVYSHIYIFDAERIIKRAMIKA